MKRDLLTIGCLLGVLSGAAAPAGATFTSSIRISTFTASATVSGATSLSLLSIIATPLPTEAFFGKNVVIPVRVVSASGPINPRNLRANFVYVLLGPNGIPLTAPIGVPVTFAADPSTPNALIGSVVIPAADLAAIQHGGSLQYVFQALQGGAATVLTAAGPSAGPATLVSLPSPFQTKIIDTICQAVSPSGSRVSAPDLFEHDGQTSVTLAPSSIASPGTLCIKQEDTSGWPAGPSGSKPAAVYTITLRDTSLTQPAQLALSYPSDINGRVLNLNVSPEDLSIFWLGPEGIPLSAEAWRVLGRSSVDTTLHTVTGFTSHFSTFALFQPGTANTAASIRPIERIITPNGDGKNDTISFPQLTAQDDVRIFDIRGRRVRTIRGPFPVWDGKDDEGGIVESGVYIYQYTSEGDRVSGVIMVAK